MRMEARRVRRRAAGMVLGLFVLGGLVPEVAMAESYGSFLGGRLTDEVMGQYGTSRRVARRTSRRTAARHSGYYGGYGAAAVAAPVGVSYVTTLPAGCAATVVGSVTYQQCGSARYRPYYQGETLVYVQE